MKKIILTIALLLCSATAFANENAGVSADLALQELKQGNARFAKHHMRHPHEGKTYVLSLAKGQHPIAVILSCSDSRVPPEILFDQGLGDLFVIRNAGNVIDEHVLGSIEYAVEHLGVNLVVVMGHETCGAVGAAMKGGEASPAVESLVKSIEPACTQCKIENKYTYENVIKAHVKLDVKAVLEDEEICAILKEGKLKVVPAYYNLTTGKVEFLK